MTGWIHELEIQAILISHFERTEDGYLLPMWKEHKHEVVQLYILFNCANIVPNHGNGRVRQ